MLLDLREREKINVKGEHQSVACDTGPGWRFPMEPKEQSLLSMFHVCIN